MSETRPLDVVLERIGNRRQTDNGWSGRCPAHDDRENSLSINEGDDGRVLLKCFRGCEFPAIVGALGLQQRDLFVHNGRGDGGIARSRNGHERSNGDRPRPTERSDVPARAEAAELAPDHPAGPSEGLSLAAYAAAKQIPEETLRGFGVTQFHLGGRLAIRFPYFHADGTEGPVRFRAALSGAGRFSWKKGSKPSLYGLWRLGGACDAGYVVIVEGESDCHTLWAAGIPAVGLPGAGNWREERDAPHLAHVEIVYVVVEPDGGGDAVRKSLSVSAIRDRVRFVDLTEFGAKDPSELYLQDPEQFSVRLQQALESATPWSQIEQAARSTAAIDAFAEARHLLDDPNVLDRIRQAIRDGGYAGSTDPPVIAYLALTSRLLDRPLNVAFVAQSSAGKNAAVNAAVALVPPEAVHPVGAGSARALVYDEASFEHRTVIFAEADSIPEDGPAAAAVRALAEDNVMRYDVVEQSPITGRWETRHIEKPGPTGLITTSTRSLGEQMGTRVLELGIPDDEDQTRKILLSHARSVRPESEGGVDVEPFHALQEWLDLAGERRVDVPFADVLAEHVPARAVRMRRDFRKLLTCIQAVALLHQRHRGRTPQGWIEASLADYGVARELLAPVFDAVAAEGVTPAMRQTVEAIEDGEEISSTELARRLTLSPSTVSSRVRRCVRGGWLTNAEHRKGHPAKLSRGAALPDETTALPSPEAVRALFERSIAKRDAGMPPRPPDGSGVYCCVGCGLPRSRDGHPCPACGRTSGIEA